VSKLSLTDQFLLRMLLSQLLDQLPERPTDWQEAAAILWGHTIVRRELSELFDVLKARLTHVTNAIAGMADVPLRVHARYTRLEILAAAGVTEWSKLSAWREGVRYLPTIPADLLAFTLNKSEGHFSPTTRYRDYAISRDLIHWESQSMTRALSPTGKRYQEHQSKQSWVLLFARQTVSERAFHFLGPADYVSHVGEAPMAVTWKLRQPMPGDLFQAFAAAVA
jgi:hypothetical protein